jgi:hypothetical protein
VVFGMSLYPGENSFSDKEPAVETGNRSNQCVQSVVVSRPCFRPLSSSPSSAILESMSHALRPIVCCYSLMRAFAAGT